MTAAVNGGQSKSLDLQLQGPADVTALDPRLVVRTQPTAGAIEVEPHFFCAVELSSPSLPWMFTPAAANLHRLRPWLVLVVVSAETCSIDPGAGERLPVLHVAQVSAELPDLSQSYAWAHAQVADVAHLKAGAAVPTSLSRLVCPRRLSSRTTYIAAIVPAFEPGRLAGLGLPVPAADTMQPAWDAATPAALDLPVYHSWTFTTGDDGDFESLVSRLKRVSLSGDTAIGRLAIIDPAAGGLPALPGWRFPGALGLCPDPLPGPNFTGVLTSLVDGTVAAPGLPVPPPLYGRWHAAERTLAGTPKPWLKRLNLDPRYRAVASIGTRLVQDHQEALMTAAWQQIGQVEAANALLRQAQLARHAGTVVHTALARLPTEALIQLAGAMLTRISDPVTRTTLASQVAASRVPPALVSGAFRRLLRPRGPLGRRSGWNAGRLLTLVNGNDHVVTPRGRPEGLFTIDDIAAPGATRWCRITFDMLSERAVHPRPPASAVQWRATLLAALALQRSIPPCAPVELPRPVRPPLDLDSFRATLLAETTPARTVTARVKARVSGPPGWAPEDPLTPIMAAPRIDTPVARDLIALSPDLLLPGIAALPTEAVTLVPVNKRFIEAVMVGVNHEMARELLWRGYPTDQRGTCMHRFWNRSGAATGPVDDIPAIDQTWTGELGTHLLSDMQQVVLLIRGEVLRRYPRMLIYATPAEWVHGQRRPATQPPGKLPTSATFPERYPAFGGTLAPDVTYAGFDLPDDVRGDPDPAAASPGWFFVFQQPPTEARFGLDATKSETVPGVGPADLSWPAVAISPSRHVDLEGPLTDLVLKGWGPFATSADLAAWCQQRPFRVCVHASDLLPPVTP
ncbi:hypothetical protein [Corallococcus exiguus]|uniref:hypothetical protein n=1 Tax=Corallococcus exiguus TaxID=83462 RepID=UPI001C275426|nr:hypothetical protein [Corallococcus exiguus]